MRVRGHFEGLCCGHALNNRLLRTLFAAPEAWREVESFEDSYEAALVL